MHTPYYIIYEDKLRKNLELIQEVSHRADVKIIMAFKANALWKTFDIVREYCNASTASSLNEMQLSLDYLKGNVHAYCPVYTEQTFPEFLKGCSYITFNSISQYKRFEAHIKKHNKKNDCKRVSAGLRINPQCSVIETDIYNPCIPGSRFGVTADIIGDKLPDGIEGLHFHALCESDSHDLEKVLEAFIEQYGKYIPQIKWLNMGGGHLMTSDKYDVEHLIMLLQKLHNSYPHLELIMEPGSAFTWQTGDLVTTVLDIVENQGIKTAIIDASFACHMPDCLEMPYKPTIAEATDDSNETAEKYRLGGNSCLSGDYCGPWRFIQPLQPGMRLTIKDMNHYTTVKTNMFNGIQHPSIVLQHINGNTDILREFNYNDYRNRMD